MSNGFRGINARVGGNIINPLPYLQQSQQANPWYNPMMKGPDLVGGMSAALNKMKMEEERKRKAGLEEREMVTKEKTGAATVTQREAMAKYYKASADAAGKDEGKTLSKKDDMMYRKMVDAYGVDSPEVTSFVVNGFKIIDPDTEYPDSVVVPALSYISKLQKREVTREQFDTMSKTAQKGFVDMYHDSLIAAEAALIPDTMSRAAVEANYRAAENTVEDLSSSEEAELILLGQYENTSEKIKAYATQTGVRLDMPYRYNTLKKLELRNPELLNNEQRKYIKLQDSTSNAFFKAWDRYGDEFFEYFQNSKFLDELFEVDDVDEQTFYCLYFIHSGGYTEEGDAEKKSIVTRLLGLPKKIAASLDEYYAK